MNYFGENMWYFCTEWSHQRQQAPKDDDLSFYAFSVYKLCSWQSWHWALLVKCLMNAATLSPPAGVSTADKTILGHGANIMLTEWEKAKGRERARDPSGCLACQIPQLHNSARLAWAPAQPAFSTTMGGEAQERPVTPGEGRNSLNPGAVIIRWMVALRRRCVILGPQNTLCSNVFLMLLTWDTLGSFLLKAKIQYHALVLHQFRIWQGSLLWLSLSI